MKNYKVLTTTGEEVWIHRSIAVAGFVFWIYKNKIYILANKRGTGTPDFQGYWNCPCGYLDFDETLHEAISREVKEECNIDIPSRSFIQKEIEDSPLQNKQNVTVRFIAILADYDEAKISIGKGGEENEVSDVKWIDVDEIDNYQWAFNHDKIIKNYVSKFYKYIN